jgi:hypothetical protein
MCKLDELCRSAGSSSLMGWFLPVCQLEVDESEFCAVL